MTTTNTTQDEIKHWRLATPKDFAEGKTIMAACVCQVCDKPYSLNLKESGGLCYECKEKFERSKQDTTTPILDLWNAMRDAGIQPEAVNYDPGNMMGDWWYSHDGLTSCSLTDEHAAFILTGHAETWLLDRSWNLIAPGDTYDREYESPEQDGRYISLPDALRAEAGRE